MPLPLPPPFLDRNSAIRSVLIEACVTLDQSGVEYVIAGGWVPCLRGGDPALRHPGTHDVDILFSDEPEPIVSAVRALCQVGYSPSAKHPFQLLKGLPLVADGIFRGVDVEHMVFNIDLMHPIEGAKDANMFHDIIDLGVRDDYDVRETHIIKSICFPSSRIIFDESLWSYFPIEGPSTDGVYHSVNVPLIDEVGLILSKCQSVSKDKRDRDSFDIYYLLSGPSGPAISEKLKALENRFPQVADQVSKLRQFVSEDAETFNSRVQKFLLDTVEGSPASKVRSLLS